MKKNRVFITTLAMSCIFVSASGMAIAGGLNFGLDSSGIEIDASHFPDSQFREIVKTFDENGNGTLSESEIREVEAISFEEGNIRSLKGIEYFTELEYLFCDLNQIEELDLSKNTKLLSLSCGYNKIKSLDLTNNKELISFSCGGEIEYIKEADRTVGKGTLEYINVSGCKNLTSIDVFGNRVSTLLFDDTPALQELDCSNNLLKELDLSGHKNLLNIRCYNNSLTTLDVSGQYELDTLFCDTNDLTELDVTHNPLLKTLHCFKNKIGSLDLSKSPALESLFCFSNQLTELDLTKNMCIRQCSTHENKISNLDIGYTVLAEVYDEKQLEDCGTYYEFNFQNEAVEGGVFFELSFDKTTKIDCSKKQKTVCKIDEENFPDPTFREYVSDFDVNHDGSFSESELASVTEIVLSHVPVKSIKGIEYFYNTAKFTYEGTTLKEIDLSSLTHLISVNIQEAGGELVVQSVNVSGCKDLTRLVCIAQDVQNLDLTNNPKLEMITVGVKSGIYDFTHMKKLNDLMLFDENLTALNLSGNKELQYLELYCDKLTSLNVSANEKLAYIAEYCNLPSLDVSHNLELSGLEVGSQKITSIDVSKNTKLETLRIYSPLESIDLSHNTNLKELVIQSDRISSVDVTHNTQLGELNCTGAKIKKVNLGNKQFLKSVEVRNTIIQELDVSSCPALQELDCAHSSLTKLDVSNNPDLEMLNCTECRLEQFPDLSKNTRLVRLFCSNVKTDTVDLQSLTELKELTLSNMDITTLNLSQNKKLIYIDLNNNLLKELDLSHCGELNYIDLRMNLFETKPKYTCKGQEHFLPQRNSSPSFESFVERLYTVALGRASEPEGKEYWINQVVEEGKTGADCARFFLLDADEFMKRNLSVEDFVETLYATFFDRESDASGKKGWVDAINSGAKTRAEVVNDFIESTEWCNVCATYGVKSGAQWHKATKASNNAINFATRLYTCCLKRDPEDEGIKYWSLALTNLEKTGAQAAQFFFESDEFIGAKLEDEEYVTRLYTTFMDRKAEPNEINYWVESIQSGKQTRHSTLAFFAQCPEFTEICKAYGIERGEI